MTSSSLEKISNLFMSVLPFNLRKHRHLLDSDKKKEVQQFYSQEGIPKLFFHRQIVAGWVKKKELHPPSRHYKGAIIELSSYQKNQLQWNHGCGFELRAEKRRRNDIHHPTHNINTRFQKPSNERKRDRTTGQSLFLDQI